MNGNVISNRCMHSQSGGVEAERGWKGSERRPQSESRQEATSPGSPARIAMRLRRESRMTLGCITQRLQMGIQTYLSHRLYGHGWEQRKKP